MKNYLDWKFAELILSAILLVFAEVLSTKITQIQRKVEVVEGGDDMEE